MTATYDLSSVTDLNRVRFHTGDTNVSAARWTDEEITYAVSAAGSWQGAVILLLTSLQAKLASTPDYQADWLTESPSKAAASLDRLIKAKRRELGVSDVSATATHQWRPDTAQTEAPYSDVYPLTTGYSTTAGSSGGSGGGSGSVTSIAITVPAGLFIATGSPVTTDGTIAINLISQSANHVFAAPNGVSGTPAFRALVAADLPDLSGTYAALSHSHAASAITSGTFDAVRIPDLSATYALAGHLHAGVYAPASHGHAAGDVTSGQMALARGGTGADLSATGAGFLKQASTGAAVTVAALADTDIPSLDATKIGSGTFDVARVPWATATDIGGMSRPAIYAGAINMTGSITHNSGLLSLNAASGYQVQMYAGATLVADVSATAATFPEPLAVNVSSSDTNTVRTLATLSHAISGVAAAGLGGGLLYQIEDAGGTLRDAASIETLWTTATGGGTSAMDIYLLDAGTKTKSVQLKPTGIVFPSASHKITMAAGAVGTLVEEPNYNMAIKKYYGSWSMSPATISATSKANPAVTINNTSNGHIDSNNSTLELLMFAAGSSSRSYSTSFVAQTKYYANFNTGPSEPVLIERYGFLPNTTSTTWSPWRDWKMTSYGGTQTIMRIELDNTDARIKLLGDVQIGAGKRFAFGDPTVNGTWGFSTSGNDLLIERLESSAWVEKGRFTA